MGTWGRERNDLGTSIMRREDLWDRDAGRQIQGRRGCERLLQKSELNAISVTFLANMFW